jgi:hypothetical protein
MVALILTRSGFDDMRPRIDATRDAIWVSAGVVSDAEAAELRRSGMNLTIFTHPLDPKHLDSDIHTVVQHHPEEVLWVETVVRR